MTSVNISTTKNTVTVDEDNPSVITVATLGPQGPAVPDGDKGDITVSNNGTVMSIDPGVVNNAKIASDAAIALSKLATGALPTGITVASANIPDLTIVNSDISASAAIALSKLATGPLPTGITVASANIPDLTIINSDISASAEIEVSKLKDGTARQLLQTDTAGTGVEWTSNIDVPGTLDVTGAATFDGSVSASTFTGNLTGNVTGNTSGSSGSCTGNAASATVLQTARTVAGTSFDGSANIDISYNNLTNKLSVGDGGLTQNNFTDTLKTKLDGIETAATADQTAAEIKTLFNSNGLVDAQIDASAAISLSKLATGALPTAITVTSANISDLSLVNADVSASAAIAGTKIDPDFGSQNIVTTGSTSSAAITATGLLKISNIFPRLLFEDTNNNDDFSIYNANGTFRINDDTDDAPRLDIASDGTVDIFGNLDVGAGLDVTGNITVTGTVDGRDVATDGSKLDGIESGATADQTKSDIDALGIAASTATTLATARTIAGTSFDGSANIDISYTNLTNKLSVGDGGLTQNNFTNTLKTKLDGITASATNVTNNNQLTNGSGYITALIQMRQ